MVVDCYSSITLLSPCACNLHIRYLPNLIQTKLPCRCYDVISIFKDGSHDVTNL